MGTRDDLIEFERGFWDAAGDGSFYEEHMAADGRCLLPVGAMDKAGTIEGIGSADPWESYSFDDVSLHEFGDEAASLTYRATAARSEGDEYHALVATTYRRVDGTWKLALHQQTPLMGDE